MWQRSNRFYVGKIGTGILMLNTGGGCGMTRAFYYILHGQFVQAQEWNQNAFLVGGSLIGIYIFDWIQIVAKIEKSKAPTKVL